VETRLDVYVYFYALDNQTPMTTALDYISKVWVALLADLTRGGYAKRTEVVPDGLSSYKPFIGASLLVKAFYKHDKTAI
jgi:hypothetical protein